MSMFPLLDTLRLLDHADQAKQRAFASPEQATTHLICMSHELGTPLTDEEAARAVAVYWSLLPRPMASPHDVHPKYRWAPQQGKQAGLEINGQDQTNRQRVHKAARGTACVGTDGGLCLMVLGGGLAVFSASRLSLFGFLGGLLGLLLGGLAIIVNLRRGV